MKKLAALLTTITFTGIGLAAAAQNVNPDQYSLVDNSRNDTNRSIQYTTFSSDFDFKLNQTGLYTKVNLKPRPRSQNYTGDVVFNETGGNTSTKTYELDIEPVFNWTIQPDSLEGSVSIGDSNNSDGFDVNVTTNQDYTLSCSVSGNVSSYFDCGVEFVNQDEYIVEPSYGIPSDTGFGRYTGNLTVENGLNSSRDVGLSYGFTDDIPPEIDSLSVDSVMSTQSVTHSLQATDNLDVDYVEGVYLRETEQVQENENAGFNETVEVNETVASYNFSSGNNSDMFTHSFSDTDVISRYWLNVSAVDESGNVVEITESFFVDGLKAVNVLENNFELESVKPTTEDNAETKALKEFMEIEESTEVNIILESLTHSVSNSTISENIGVLKPGDSVADTFDGVNDSITVDESGAYSLVVKSNKVESYNGEIGLETVPQHVDIDDSVIFSGRTINPVYPQPENYSIGGFEGRIEFQDNLSAVKDAIEFHGYLEDAGDCRGVETWSQCLTGFSLGEIDEIEQRNNELESKNSSLFWQRNIAVVVTALFLASYIRTKNLVGKHVAVVPVKS